MADHEQQLIHRINNFFKKYINLTAAETGTLPSTEHNPDWLSPCLQSDRADPGQHQQIVHWQPVRRELNNDLEGIEQALEIKLHPDIKTFFTSFWSDHVDAVFQNGNLTLLFIWNDEDMQALIKNQLGHVLDKRRNRLDASFFIACTDSDFIISIENTTGHIVLERPGSRPEKILAGSLTEFFDQLEPGKLL